MILNTEKITNEFCQGKILFFHPQSEAEAELIQGQLFEMGYKWNGNSAPQEASPELRQTAAGNMFLSVAQGLILRDGLLSCGPFLGDDTVTLCTSAQLDEKYSYPHEHDNTEIITKEFCSDKLLLFFPKTDEEAEFIQRKIFEIGCGWVGTEPEKTLKHAHDCVLKGMMLADGLLAFNPTVNSLENGLLCTSDQFGEKYKSRLDLELQHALTEKRLQKLRQARSSQSPFSKKF